MRLRASGLRGRLSRAPRPATGLAASAAPNWNGKELAIPEGVSTSLPIPAFRPPARKRHLPSPGRAASRAFVRTVRAGFSSLASFAPDVSALCAEMLFRLPPRQARLVRERRAIEAGAFEFIPHRGGRIATWTLGEGPPILTAHGWGGHAGRLSAFFEPLVEAGFSVIAFDAPGHGRSSGSFSSLPDFVSAVETLAQARGPIAGAVGHSAGAAAIALAIRRGARLPRAALLAPPADPEHYAARFAHYMGIPAAVRDAMKRRLEVRYGMGWSDLRLSNPSPSAARIVVFHDRNDASVPWKEGASIVAAWPGARMISTRGLGHHRILRHPSVVASVVRFLAGVRRNGGRRPKALRLSR